MGVARSRNPGGTTSPFWFVFYFFFFLLPSIFHFFFLFSFFFFFFLLFFFFKGASRHHSRYLVVNQQVEFYQTGGDLAWLEGLEQAPAKIQRLAEINALLAHQPWLIKEKHILALTTGEDSWSLPELVQAVTILSSFHCLAAFGWGSGISIELDRRGEHAPKMTPTLLSPEEADVDGDTAQQNTSELVNRLKQFTEKSDTDSISSSSSTTEVAQKFFEESEHGQSATSFSFKNLFIEKKYFSFPN